MNCWPDGTTLINEDYERIAMDHGLADAAKIRTMHGTLHYDGWYSSWLHMLTKDICLDMMHDKKLVLRTATYVAPPAPSLNAEVLAFLTKA